MKTSAHDDVPRLSGGSLAALFRCSLRLAGRLGDEQTGRRGADPSLRLWTALTDVLRAAHDHAWDLSVPLEDAVSDAQLAEPPAILSVEESALYRSSLAAYLDAFGDDERAAIHPRAGDALRRRVQTNPPFDLTGRADLLFAFEERSPLIRRISLRGSPQRNGDGDPSVADMSLAVLLGLDRGPAPNDVVLRSETLWLASDATVTESRVTGADLSRFRRRLYIEIEASMTAPSPSPGWWCTTCERLSNCPAVSSDPPHVVLARLRNTAP